MSSQLFDPGLQPERSELAWRRTALSIGVGALVSVRLFPALFGSPVWVVPGLAGVAIAGVLWVLSRRRYEAVADHLLGRSSKPLPGGGLLAFLGAVSISAGLLGAGVVALVATGH